MDFNELPINSKPPIIGLLHHAYPLSIISVNEDFYKWFYTKYINLHCSVDLVNNEHWVVNFFDNDTQPIITEYVDRASFKDSIELMDYIKSFIDNSFYIQPFVDEYYIPSTEAYMKRHFDHEILIYGYDVKERTVSIIGFNKRKQYSPARIPIDSLFLAYQNCKLSMRWMAPITTVMKYNINFNFIFDYENVKKSLYYYLSSYKFGKDENLFGMQTYEMLKIYLLFLKLKKVKPDIRSLHILWEHKKIMLGRLTYLKENYSVTSEDVEEYNNVEIKARYARDLMIKYLIVGNNEIIDEIYELLNEIQRVEEQVLLKINGSFMV